MRKDYIVRSKGDGPSYNVTNEFVSLARARSIVTSMRFCCARTKPEASFVIYNVRTGKSVRF
jgi:hypothetical protein